MNPSEALDYKLRAITNTSRLKFLVGNKAIRSNVSVPEWEQTMAALRLARPVVWSKPFLDLATTGGRQLFNQGILFSNDDVPADPVPLYGNWHMFETPPLHFKVDRRFEAVDSDAGVHGIVLIPTRFTDTNGNGFLVRLMVEMNNEPVVGYTFDIYGNETPVHTLDRLIADIEPEVLGESGWSEAEKPIASKIFRDECASLIGLIRSLQVFLGQSVLAKVDGHIERHSRKRAERAGVEPTVHVVRLRREVNDKREYPSHEVEWHCRWVVRGHWRHQFLPSANKHELRWIMPYIKGPEDKPFKEPLPAVGVVIR